MKTTKLLDCPLIRVCAVIRLNAVDCICEVLLMSTHNICFQGLVLHIWSWPLGPHFQNPSENLSWRENKRKKTFSGCSHKQTDVCLFMLRFYGPVNPMGSC